MAPSFGTSGVRGLVRDLHADVVSAYVHAFNATCPTGGRVFVGRDLRPSSPNIASAVIRAVQAAGLEAVDCGGLPTPALAQACMAAGAGAVMVTGSHIPADRNGLKFYTPNGEITKRDEARIVAAFTARQALRAEQPGRLIKTNVTDAYAARVVSGFRPGALTGLRVGVYRHSSVARDILQDVLSALGAIVVPLGHSHDFVPVDTEAVKSATRAMLADWCAAHGLDAVVSTDGDGDRPMLVDATGHLLSGDVLGVLTAQGLGATEVVTPISSNDMVEDLGFAHVTRTRIGSPHVIAGMAARLAENSIARVVGFEGNGGFLLGFEASGMQPLMTRDAILPLVAVLARSVFKGGTVARLVTDLPACHTATDSIQDIAPEQSAAFLARIDHDKHARAALFADLGEIARIDRTDGLRMYFNGGQVVHLRPSGNAPEFRVYVQSNSRRGADALLATCLSRVALRLRL
ncbi:Phosphoglucosamine mutase [Rhodobacteraceae bacterium THAF1]|uniref:phosphomannomutase n=1 Tax=Palleronia sp. THAF1 TaxID=2587842 RepID=UPI000F41ACFA|nr:phosphomannomutase [Palleronia sp. THAF1]QFU07712.1 Phosphoglucosamine mutase [Palleronia sp. THAF1]VDC23168.1 Phosphoglucosamine mutase [Rhodobacteraceae bacterium THAF1]